MYSSVLKSTFAVASSSNINWFLLKIALAIQSIYFSPIEKILLALLISYNNLLSNLFIFSLSPAADIHSHIYSSEYSLRGSTFLLTVPVNKKGVYGIIDIFFLNRCNPIYFILTPFIRIIPDEISVILNIAYIIDDFPAPVLPTIPTFSPFFISNSKLFKTKFCSFVYFMQTF